MESNFSINDMVIKAYELAYFIIGDKKYAIEIATAALSKQEIASAAQDKRLYYTPRGRAPASAPKKEGFRTKVSMSELHLLQRLIYVESEPYERQKEQANNRFTLDEESMIIYFIKHLVRITIKRNSFHVALGLGRLLHNYSTVETQEIYNVLMQDPDRVKDDYYYRSRKGRLMQEMRQRFDNLLITFKGPRGEERFKARERVGSFAELVRECLTRFTPWKTACPVPAAFDPLADTIHPLSFAGGAPDEEHRIEMNRFHATLHPECYRRLIEALGFDAPELRMEIPIFNFSSSNSQGPPNDRLEPPELGQEELIGIIGSLAEQAARRKMAGSSLLRILVDGNELSQLDPTRSRLVRFEVDEDAELIEVRGGRMGEDTLLAVCVLPFNETVSTESTWETSVILEGGQDITFTISPLVHNPGQISGAVVAVKYRETHLARAASLRLRQLLFRISQARGAKGWSSAASLKPALTLGLILLCLAAILYIRNREPDRPVTVATDQTAPKEGGQSAPEPAGSSDSKNEIEVPIPKTTPPGGSDKAPVAAGNGRRDSSRGKRPARLTVTPDSSSELFARVTTKDLMSVPELDRPAGADPGHTRGIKSKPGSLLKVKTIYIQPLANEPPSQQIRDLLTDLLQANPLLTISGNRQEADAALRLKAKRKSKAESGAEEIVSITVQLVDENLRVIWPTARNIRGRRYTGPSKRVAAKIAGDLLEDYKKMGSQ